MKPFKEYENDYFLYELDRKIEYKQKQILSDCNYYSDKIQDIKLRLSKDLLIDNYSGLNSLGEFQNASKFDILISELCLLLETRKNYLACIKIQEKERTNI